MVKSMHGIINGIINSGDMFKLVKEVIKLENNLSISNWLFITMVGLFNCP